MNLTCTPTTGLYRNILYSGAGVVVYRQGGRWVGTGKLNRDIDLW